MQFLNLISLKSLAIALLCLRFFALSASKIANQRNVTYLCTIPKKLSPEIKEESIMESMEKMDNDIDEYIDEGVKKTKTFFNGLIIGVFLLILAGGIAYLFYANYTYSEGTRAGSLVKISKKGSFLKTYEGQLKLGGINLDHPSKGLSDTWSFSISDKSVAQQLEKLQGQKVILRYKEINKAMPWQGDTNYFVTAIEK